mmetsp:Transcript_30852/g.75234  ORF Transcript_30852/g.75234 Transcript_30852/m.75234 type:complete len:613 (-) Transcript_30852:339-2177(-)
MGGQISVENDLGYQSSIEVFDAAVESKTTSSSQSVDGLSFSLKMKEERMLTCSGLVDGKEYKLIITPDAAKMETVEIKFRGTSIAKGEKVKLKLSELLTAKDLESVMQGKPAGALLGSNLNGGPDVASAPLSGTDDRKTVSEGEMDSDQVESKLDSAGCTMNESSRLPAMDKHTPAPPLPTRRGRRHLPNETSTTYDDSFSTTNLSVDEPLPGYDEHQALPELKKTDRKKHTTMATRVAEDIKDIAEALGKSSKNSFQLKKRKRDLRRENKWIEMKKYLEKHNRWPSRRQLKERVRKGIPQSLRGYTWLRLLGADKKIMKNKGLYSRLSVLGKPKGDPEPFRTIDKDVPRTFPENHYLHGDDKKNSAAERLREVLYAYVHYDKEVQYCQGMNLVAAFLMISCPFQNEEVFWMLERLCHHSDYSLKLLYGPELSLAFEFEFVLKKLMKSFLPKLYKTIKRADEVLEPMVPFGSVNVFAPKWVISLWSILPSHCAVRIWDIFFNEGHKMLYRVALFVLKQFQAEILKVADDKGLDGGDYLVMLTNLKQSKFINELKCWEDDDATIAAILKLTGGLKNSTIASLKRRFWKEKKKKQLELEIQANHKKRVSRGGRK